MSLSIAIATYNEENNIETCLNSVKDIADEIVVADGGSKDKTVDIVKKYKAKILNLDNPPIFHINKQKAIDSCTKEWILQLDADERVSGELSKEIKKELDRNDRDINGYWIPRKNYFLGRFLTKGGQYPDYTLRLYRRGKGKLPQKTVHEQAVVEGKVDFLKKSLLHMSDLTFSRYLLRFSRYTDLFASEMKDKKVSKNPLSIIKYLLVLPIYWFLLTYFRHKGFFDSWQGFVFSFFSSLRFPVSYIKYIYKYYE